MSDKYAFLRAHLPELVEEAARKGAINPRAQMIIDLLADYDALLSLNAELLEALESIMEDMDSEFGTDYDYAKARAVAAKARSQS